MVCTCDWHDIICSRLIPPIMKFALLQSTVPCATKTLPTDEFVPGLFSDYRCPIWDLLELIKFDFEKLPIPIVLMWAAWQYPPKTSFLVEIFLQLLPVLKFCKLIWVLLAWQMVCWQEASTWLCMSLSKVRMFILLSWLQIDHVKHSAVRVHIQSAFIYHQNLITYDLENLKMSWISELNTVTGYRPNSSEFGFPN